jgi:hypothetical protein
LIQVKINSEEELVRITTELLFISVNLRKATKDWGEHFGAYYLGQKKRWENRMDNLIEKLQQNNFDKFEKQSEIEIKINQ